MTPEQTNLANTLLKLRDVFTEFLTDPQDDMGIYWQPSNPFSRKTFVTFSEGSNLSSLLKGASNQEKVKKILTYLRYLCKVELLVLLNEFEQELVRLGVEVKPVELPKINPPVKRDKGSSNRSSPFGGDDSQPRPPRPPEPA